MKITKVILHNFRIYKGTNTINLNVKANRNINIVAGKNGFGKTTFLTSLIWCFYGKLMGKVEDKYRLDIKNAGGYESYLNSLMNKKVRQNEGNKKFSVEIELEDLLIPSIPCRKISIKRTYDFNSQNESLEILIDDEENELTKDVGYEVFINDFILPREIAKFFFFDAEKIVSLAEAKTKSELRSLSKAYSEVLGIKKYEELKNNLQSLLTNLKRRGVSKIEKSKLDELLAEESAIEKRIERVDEKLASIKKQLQILRDESDSLQEKLIREGNEISIDELKLIKQKRDELKQESVNIKNRLKKLLDLAPLVIAGKKLKVLNQQVLAEKDMMKSQLSGEILNNELTAYSRDVLSFVEEQNYSGDMVEKLKSFLDKTIADRTTNNKNNNNSIGVLLEYDPQTTREFEAIYNNIKSTFLEQFQQLVSDERTNKAILNRTVRKIKQAEARKDNRLAKQYREEKLEVDKKIETLFLDKGRLLEEQNSLANQFTSHKKVRSEYEKQFNLIETDKKKYEATELILEKVNTLILKIKETKKYALQKAISMGLKKLMHKQDFIQDVKVNIENDVMDIDLLDQEGNVIDKEVLSKGEQQLYATALLKALVDESGIRFPVFIDSPLQKFDKSHSRNIIEEFYPSISEQVVIFPLLEKELTEKEFDLLNPKLNKTYLIHNSEGASSFKETKVNQLFEEFKKEIDVNAH